jgi:hypothetical protein
MSENDSSLSLEIKKIVIENVIERSSFIEENFHASFVFAKIFLLLRFFSMMLHLIKVRCDWSVMGVE